jgi:D-threo-aldose 1-dehydrogenase
VIWSDGQVHGGPPVRDQVEHEHELMKPNSGAIETALYPRPLGRTGLSVTPICLGTSAIGSMPEIYGYETPEDRAMETLLAAFESRINFLDTAAGYADGASERRIGEAIKRRGGLPDGFIVATKVDAHAVTRDYSAAQVRRSCEGSLERLGMERVPLLYLHDPEVASFDDVVAPGGAVDELVKLRDEGLAEHLGLAGGPVDLMSRYLDRGVFEVLLSHNRWTLVDRSADRLFDRAIEKGVAVVNAAPFGGGILATGTSGRPTYAYDPASPEMLDAVRRIEGICAAAGVPLAAAALQFSLREPRVTSTIVGLTRPERIAETERLAAWPVPEEVWSQLATATTPAGTWLY